MSESSNATFKGAGAPFVSKVKMLRDHLSDPQKRTELMTNYRRSSGNWELAFNLIEELKGTGLGSSEASGYIRENHHLDPDMKFYFEKGWRHFLSQSEENRQKWRDEFDLAQLRLKEKPQDSLATSQQEKETVDEATQHVLDPSQEEWDALQTVLKTYEIADLAGPCRQGWPPACGCAPCRDTPGLTCTAPEYTMEDMSVCARVGCDYCKSVIANWSGSSR